MSGYDMERHPVSFADDAMDIASEIAQLLAFAGRMMVNIRSQAWSLSSCSTGTDAELSKAAAEDIASWSDALHNFEALGITLNRVVEGDRSAVPKARRLVDHHLRVFRGKNVRHGHALLASQAADFANGIEILERLDAKLAILEDPTSS